MAGIGNFADDFPLVHNPPPLHRKLGVILRGIRDEVRAVYRCERDRLMTERIAARRQERRGYVG
jgi:hypothetical protein